MRAAGRPDNPPRDEGTPDVPSTRLAPCTVRTVVATLSPVLDVTSRGRWGTAELRFSVPTCVPPSPRHPAPGRSGGRHRRALFCCRFAAEHTDLEGDVTWKRPPSVRGAPGSQTPWSGLRTTLWASRRPPLLGRPPPHPPPTRARTGPSLLCRPLTPPLTAGNQVPWARCGFGGSGSGPGSRTGQGREKSTLNVCPRHGLRVSPG